MVKNIRQKKYYAPQNEDIERKCDFPGCDKKGEYRAPKNRGLKEYYWFCLDHVQAYNAKWNYYSDETQDSEESYTQTAHQQRRMHFNRGFRSKVKYQFGYDFNEELGEFGKYTEDSFEYSDIYFNEKERGYLRIMELHADNISVELIKKQYKKLVKKYHPDLHRDDKKEAEEKFKQLTIAYQGLMAKFS